MAVFARPLVFVLILATWLAGCTAKGPRADEVPEFAEFALTDSDPGTAYFEWRAAERTRPPISLTNPDGDAPRLVSLDAKVVIEDPLAFTELTLNFANPEPRPGELTLDIELPPGATMSRVALLIDDEWRDAEVVAREVENVVHRDALHGRHHPALREHQAGNRFRAWIHPVPQQRELSLLIAHAQPLGATDQRYRLPLAGLSRLEHVRVSVDLVRSGHDVLPAVLGGRSHELERLLLSEDQLEPTGDLELHFEREVVERGLRHGELVIGRIAPLGHAEPEPISGLTILFDTSASRALDFDDQVERLTKLIAALADDADFPLELLGFDHSLMPIYSGNARGFAAAARERLLARHPLGASDLVGALEQLAAREQPVQARLLVVSDGIATLGSRDHVQLRRVVADLGARGVERVDALIDGGLRDSSMLRALTVGNLAHDGLVVEASLDAGTLVAKLERATRSGITVEVKGAEWVWPAVLDGVQPGDELLVHAKLPPNRPMIVTLHDRGEVRRIGVPTRAAQGVLFERAWAQAQLDEMGARLRRMPFGGGASESEALARTQLHNQIIALSLRERVLTDFTALCLPSSADHYERLGIERNELADIHVIGLNGVERLARSRLPITAPTGYGLATGLRDEQFDVSGNFALTHDDAALWRELLGIEQRSLAFVDSPFDGSSEQWIGLGDRMSRPRTNYVRIGQLKIQGKLDRDITRRIVRAHINELNGCHAAAQAREPSVGGQVSVQFVVASNGKVGSAVVLSSTIRDVALANCAAKTMRRWSFPKSTSKQISLVTVPVNFVAAPQQPKPAPPTGPWSEHYGKVMSMIERGDHATALAEAWRWRNAEPDSDLALLALGEAAKASGQLELADRAYGSLIDLYPSREDFRRLVEQRRSATRER